MDSRNEFELNALSSTDELIDHHNKGTKDVRITVPGQESPQVSGDGRTVLRVYLMDGSYKAVKVDQENITVEELWITLALEKCMLTTESAPCFFVWGVKGDLELLLYTHQKLSSVFKDWSIYEERYHPPDLTKINRNSTSPLTLSRSTLARGLSVKNLKAKMQGHNPEKSTNGYSDENELRLLFRTTAVLTQKEEAKHRDPGAIHLFYLQAVHNVIQANYPCTKEVAIKLGGIQLQLTVGNRNPSLHKEGYLSDIISKYVPEHLLPKMRTEEWEHVLYQEHETLRDKDALELKYAYLSLVRQWPYYGCSFIKAKFVPTESWFAQEFEGKVRVGVNENGLHLIDPRAMKIVTTPFTSIVNWHSKRDLFSVEIATDQVTKTFLGKSKPITRAMHFKSLQAELITDSLCDWVEHLSIEVGDQKPSKSHKDKKKG